MVRRVWEKQRALLLEPRERLDVDGYRGISLREREHKMRKGVRGISLEKKRKNGVKRY